MRLSIRLVGLRLLCFPITEAFVDWLTAAKAVFDRVPKVDAAFTQPPAEENDVAVELAREVEKAGVEVLDLNTDRVYFGNRILGSLHV